VIPRPAPPGPPSPLFPAPLPPGAGPDRLLPPLPPGTHQPPPPDPAHFAPTADMGGPLIVSSAGGTTIATDGMRAAVDRARAVAHSLDHALRAVRRADTVPRAPSTIHLQSALRAASASATRLSDGLHEAVARYSAADRDVWAAFDGLSSATGAAIGMEVGLAARLAAGVFGASLLIGGAPAVMLAAAQARELKAAIRTLKSGGGGSGLGRFLVEHPQLLSNPRFVAAVRGITDGLDEGMSTAAGLPPAVAVALGATGATGVSSSAGVLMGAGPAAGLLKESPVDVRRVDRQPVAAPPSGAAERLARVPEGDQVRIEKYSSPGRADRFVVYVGPTETFDPRPEGEPWDLASNVGGVGGEAVGSIRATELAMRDAGITSGSEVQLVGFSQGGMVATRVAADGGWNAVGLQTFGAPAGNVALPDGIQGMQVRNSEDFIPALAGPQTDHHLLQVQRTVYADPAQMPTDQAAPGHQRVAYAATAQAIDAARSAQVREQSDALDAFTADYATQPGARITAYSYHAVRRDGS
jgi:hypothetical protein